VSGFGSLGYSRTAKGAISPIQARGSDNLQGLSIDDAGTITGTCGNDGNMTHGFVRSTDGTITLFDPPHSFGTFPSSIAAGTITGFYEDPGPNVFGFLRTSDGVFTSFKAPNGGALQNVTAINASGSVTGYYGYYGLHLPTYGLIRDPDGSMTSFVVPGATNTYPHGINASGTVVGYYTDANTAYHGFERSRDGTITTFDAPGASTTSGLGTIPFSINDAGLITGSYTDQNEVGHGFIVTP
jgi:probable HAF family extracellular repeat protein